MKLSLYSVVSSHKNVGTTKVWTLFVTGSWWARDGRTLDAVRSQHSALSVTLNLGGPGPGGGRVWCLELRPWDTPHVCSNICCVLG